MESNDGTVEESIYDLEAKFTTSTRATQQKLLNQLTSSASAIANHEDYVGRIVEVLFSTLIYFGDKKIQQQTDDVVRTFSKHSTVFSKSVIARIQKIVQRFTKLGSPFASPHDQRTICHLFSWNIVVLEGVTNSSSALALFQEQVDNNSTFFQAAITQQIWLSSAISVLAASKHLKMISFFSRLRNAFLNCPDILQQYIQFFSQVSEITVDHATVIGAVFNIAYSITTHPSKKGPKIDINSIRPKFVEWYMKSVLNSTTKVLVSVHELFAPLLKQINLDEFKSILLPCISRVIKRNPEVVLETVAFCLKHLSIDLASFGVEVAQVLQIPLLSTNDVIKRDAKLTLASLLAHITDSDTLSKIQQLFVKNLKDKPPNWQDRVALCLALELFYFPSFPKLVDCSIAALADQIDAENNDEGRANELQILGRYMNKTLDLKDLQTDKAFNTIIKNVQSDKDNIRLNALEAAVLSVRQRIPSEGSFKYRVDEQRLQKFRGLVQHLVKLIKAAKADGILALLLMEILSADSTLSAELLKSQSLLTTSFGNDSFLFKHTFISKLRDQDLKDLASLLVSVVSNPKLSVILAKTDLSTLFTTLTNLTVSNMSVRRHAIDEIIASAAFGPFFPHLVSSFFKHLSQINKSNLDKASSHILREAITTLIRPVTADILANKQQNNNNESSDSIMVLTKLLLISHHPVVQGIENRNSAFSLTSTHKINEQGIVSENFPKIVEHILTYLHPENGYFADSCINVFRSVAQLRNLQALLSTAVTIISSNLDKNMQELNGLSSTEIGIYRTPAGQLFVKDLKVNTAAASNVQVSREKHRRGERGLYSVEDQKWEQQMRQELEQKKKKENEAAEAQAREEQLKKEAAVRESVMQKVEKFHNTVQVLNGLCEANSNALTRFLPSLSEVAWELLGTSKLGNDLGLDSIYQLIQHLSLCVRPVQLAQFSELRLRLAWCLVHIHHYYHFLHRYTTTVTDKSNLKEKEIHKDETDFVVSAVQETIAALHKASKLHGWSATTESFSYYFHILEFCIVNAHLTSCFITKTATPAVLPANPVALASEHLDEAIALIEDHLKPPPCFPTSPKLISLLLYLISQYAKYKQRSSTALIQLLPQLVVSTDKSYSVEETACLDSLFKGLFDSSSEVRLASISALAQIPAFTKAASNPDSTIPSNDNLAVSIWFSSFDANTEVAAIAKQLWQAYDQSSQRSQIPSLPEIFIDSLRHHLSNNDSQIQKIAAASITEGLKIHSKKLQETVDTLFALYNQNHPTPNERKAATAEVPEKVKTRIGIALCLGSLANHPNFDAQIIAKVFDFLVNTSLFDINDDARQAMVQCGLDIINAKGTSESLAILALVEKYLSSPSGNTYEHDRVRESLVIFLGSVAKHLPQDNNNGSKTLDILNRLIQTLKTPSESVQRAVCTCLIPLMNIPSIQAQSEALVNQMLEMLQTSNVYAERRGAAFGLAGMVKGLGITSLKKYNVITVLQNAIEDKKHSNARQGALFAFECLSAILQRLFEPYVIQILPKLLVCFGDNSADVRDATVDTARAIMSQLSGHGVKLVLPALLKSLEDRSNWKSKKGSIELLGSMAFCAPKQLSACLPMIVPRLSAVLTDSHEQVQEAAKEALAHIGSVIRNPEIQNHVPLLLQAMDDPDQYTKDCLEALIHTNFVHTIDAASLSLIIPILHRGMKERSTETKKKAAQIIGNMYSLTEFKDLEPYVDLLVEDLKVVLSDPIPEVRATTAKALGSLIKGMTQQSSSSAGPDDISNTVVPYLLATMKSEAGSVERSGAAQGLSEILAGLPTQKFEELLQEIQQNASNPKPHVREGYIGLFVFLPSTMTQTFQNYLKTVLPIVLAGLSDESEAVREVSLRAGQAIVNQYAQTALPLLLPTLEEGLFDDNWRIRQSSVQLLGDLLYRVISKASTGTEDDTGAILTTALGAERRNRVLSALYMIRSDVSSVVRQKALLVWKSVVSNTPKTLKEILPSMMRALIDCLGSENLDKRQVAGKTLGDLVEKLGDKILPEIIPILENGLESPDAHTRQGVCIGLSEVMSTTAKAQLVMYADVLIPAVRRALVDPLPEVREAAGQAFDTLYKNIGSKAIDEIVPRLLIQLQSAETPELMNSSLDAIREIMAVRSNVVLPLLLPKLLSPPVTVSNIRALASVADVAGGAINYHLSDLIPPLVKALAETHSSTLASELATDIRNSAETIVLAVQSEGVHLLFSELVKQLESEEPLIRTEAVYLIGAFCAKTKIQFESEANLLLESLLLRFNDKERQVQQAAWQALGNLTEAIRKDNLPNYIPFVRGVLTKMRPSPNSQVLGFGLPKGLAPILPMFLNGLMLGSPTIREEAAYGLGDLISLTPEDVLKPFLIQITGPLIRIIGDRFPHTVKAAILQTLNLLISKGGPLLRPFVPQLQTTFVKALHDTNRIVRVHAATALGLLMTLTTKVDPLVNELLNGISSSDDGVQESMLSALKQVLLKLTNQLSPETLDKVIEALQQLLADDQEVVRTLTAKVVGAYVKTITQTPENPRTDSLFSILLSDKNLSAAWQLKHGYCAALAEVLKHVPKQYIQKYEQNIVSHVLKYAGDDKVPVRQVAGETVGRLLAVADQLKSGELAQLLSVIGQLIGDSSNDVKLTALKETKKFAKMFPSVAVQHLGVLVPPIMVGLRDKTNFPVKLASERALVHLLQIHTNPAILQQYSQTQDATSAKNLLDYSTRVLSKLAAKSDSEDDNSD